MIYFEAMRNVAADRSVVWDTLVDLDLSDNDNAAAPHLGHHEIVSGEGEGMIRRCTNTDGQSWRETCTGYDAGRMYAFTVDTSDYPYPLSAVIATVVLEDVPGGSRINVRYDLEFPAEAGPNPEAGLIPFFNPVAQSVLDAWEAAATANVAAS